MVKKKEMKISGFTFVRNATKLYLPVRESITSVLPLVDEFIIALGDCDHDDRTLEEINKIGSDKIRIIRTKWDVEAFPSNTIYAQQTDIAMKECIGDWLFYIQSDEAIHEKDHLLIKKACTDELENKEVEGFVFDYKHFWGDFNHFHKSHAWYSKEIRIVRNRKDIHSWRDAQSFRSFDTFDENKYEDYKKKEGSRKLNTKSINAGIFHYGYVRPPEMMVAKRKVSISSYHGEKGSEEQVNQFGQAFDYGPLNKLPKFSGTHPKVMEEWIKKFDWGEKLQYSGSIDDSRVLHRHEKLKYRVLSFIEHTFLNGRSLGGFENFHMIR